MVQIYVRGKTPTIDDFISCLRTRLSENIEMRDASLDISADDPCIVVCQRLTRYSSDISTGTRDLSEPLNNKAIIVLHVTEEHALPNFLPADNIKREFPGFGLIVDIACLDGDIYSCDMNTEGLRKLQIFLKEQKSQKSEPQTRGTCKEWDKVDVAGWTCLTLIGLGISQIVVGAIYIHDCSIEKMIPIYLIVSGLILSSLFIVLLLNSLMNDGCSMCLSIYIIGDSLLYLVWCICGAVWVLPAQALINKDTYIPETEGTCNNTLLKFSVVAVAVAFFCWLCLIMYCSYLGIKKLSCYIDDNLCCERISPFSSCAGVPVEATTLQMQEHCKTEPIMY